MSGRPIAPLYKPDDRVAVRQLGRHVGLLAVLGLWVCIGLPMWGAVLFLLAVSLAALSALQHACVHRTAFKTAWINELVGYVTGFLMFQPFQWYRLDHLEHHRLNGLRTTLNDHPETMRELLIYVSGITVWREKANAILENGGGLEESDFIGEDLFPKLRREAQLMIILYVHAIAFTIFISPILFWIWLLPLILGTAILRMFELAVARGDFDNSRTGRLHQVIKQLTWNMSYVKEHYAMPDVPYHKLPQIHALAHPNRSAFASMNVPA